MQKLKRWKSPENKKWFMFVVDGKTIACIENSAVCRKEIKRLRGLMGVDILPASDEALIRFNAFTVVPSRIRKKMNDFYIEAQRRYSVEY